MACIADHLAFLALHIAPLFILPTGCLHRRRRKL